jgi:hypothetical protein
MSLPPATNYKRKCIMQTTTPSKETIFQPYSEQEQETSEILSLALSPTGYLYLYSDPNNQESISTKLASTIRSFFTINDAVGLLRLGLIHIDTPLPTSISFWQQFSRLFIAEMCKRTSFDDDNHHPPLDIVFSEQEVNELIDRAPFMRGAEYLNQECAKILWQRLNKALVEELISLMIV